MKRIFLLLLMANLATANTAKDTVPAFVQRWAPAATGLGTGLGSGTCDACGCSASGGSMGFSSMLATQYVGIRYLNQRYESRDGIFNNSPIAKEKFNTWQLWSKFPISKKVQMIALLPYHAHERERVSGNESISGIGDFTVLAYFEAWKTKSDSTQWSHSVQLGGGVKAPTGKYDAANNAGSVNASFQIGTGSWDYLLAAEYSLNYQMGGLMLNGNYTFKTENNKDFRFGNQLNYGATFFYMFEPGRYKLMPQAGVAGEKYEANHQYGLTIADTAGDVLFGKLGVEASRGKFSAGLSTMLPMTQNLNGGMVDAKYRWSVNLNYSL